MYIIATYSIQFLHSPVSTSVEKGSSAPNKFLGSTSTWGGGGGGGELLKFSKRIGLRMI